MKLSFCLLIAVMAAVSADQGFYKPQAVAQSAPGGYNNYYDYQHQPPKQQGYVRDRCCKRDGVKYWIVGVTVSKSDIFIMS